MASKHDLSGLKLAFIGFSEAGQAIGGGLAAAGARRVTAYDLRFDEEGPEGAALKARAGELGVEAASSAVEACAGADMIVSTVTAGAALAVAREAAGFIAAGQIFLDLNSVSPDEKRAGAAAIEAAGGAYVEGAVVSPVAKLGHKVPMLLAGPEAERLAERLSPLGMALDVVGEEIGVASTIKMCRSIIMKGLEALTLECLVTARRYGVEERVIASLDQALPNFDWRGRAGYMVGRVTAHAARRAEEMRCAAATVRAVGLEPLMAEATAARQQWVADLDPPPPGASQDNVLAQIDALIARCPELRDTRRGG